MIIRRVGPVSCAKIVGVIYAGIGLVVGGAISIFALLGAAFASTQRTPNSVVSPLIGVALGVGAIVIFPIFYGVIGFVGTLIGAWLYNLIAARFGGIEIDLA